MNTAPLDSLPQSIRDLAEVIGVAAALTIVKARWHPAVCADEC